MTTLKRTYTFGETPIGTIWQHRKSGGIYAIFATCQIEATNEEGVLYHSTQGHGPLWCRPSAEFFDGRFRPILPAPNGDANAS